MFFIWFPGFQIFRYLSAVLKRYFNGEVIDLSMEPKVKKLKFYLIVQFVLNILLGLGSGYAPSQKDLSSVTNPEISHSMSLVFQLLDKYSNTFAYTKWLTISLDYAMPIIYLLLLYICVNYSRESARIRSELNDVV